MEIPAALSSWMGFVIYILEILLYDLGIDLRGGDIAMTEHLLKRVKIGSSL